MRITLDLYRAPKWRLEKLKKDYEEIIYEAQSSIRKIDNIITSREAQARHREKLKEYGLAYAKICGNGLDRALIERIMHDLACDENYALQVAEISLKLHRAREKSKRDKRIVVMADFMSKKEIAEREKISRQQVHNIIKKASQ